MYTFKEDDFSIDSLAKEFEKNELDIKNYRAKIFLENFFIKDSKLYFNVTGDFFNKQILNNDFDLTGNSEKKGFFFVFGFNCVMSEQHLKNSGVIRIFFNQSYSKVNNTKYFEYLEKLNHKLQEIEFSVEEESGSNKEEYILTNIYFSASPQVNLTKNLIFFAKGSNIKYPEICKMPNNILNGNMFNDVYESVDCFYVGQGNCSIINAKNAANNIMVDVGRTSRYFKSGYDKMVIDKNFLKISQTNCNNFIITHFDLDHIIGVKYLLNNSLKKNWILPDMKKMNLGLNAKRFVNYLAKYNNSNLYIMNQYTKINKATLYLGSGVPQNNCNVNNASGIIFELSEYSSNPRNSTQKRILFPGDCVYNCWPTSLKNNTKNSNIDFMYVPHHGCKNAIDTNSNFHGGMAVLSVGKNPFLHPFVSTKNMFASKKFTIITLNRKKDIKKNQHIVFTYVI